MVVAMATTASCMLFAASLKNFVFAGYVSLASWRLEFEKCLQEMVDIVSFSKFFASVKWDPRQPYELRCANKPGSHALYHVPWYLP